MNAMKSWIAYAEDSHFPLQNLPFCSFIAGDDHPLPQVGVRIGDIIVSFQSLLQLGLIDRALVLDPELPAEIPWLLSQMYSEAVSEQLDLQMLPIEPSHFLALRRAVQALLQEDNPELRDHPEKAQALYPVEDVDLLLPLMPSSFVDFYSGINHASNVGKMFRPDQPPLLPNYRHLPVGYNGRASSVVVSGQDIVRPRGQQKIGDDVVFAPTRELDFELEMGFFVAQDSEMGEPIPIERCEDHILGMVIVNDWSARDVQRWEYQPLGPFLSKSFATSISPYIVPLEALEPFRIDGLPQDPEPLPHLRHPNGGKPHYDIQLEVALQTPDMSRPQVICRSNTKHLYWSMMQQLAHQTSNGTPVLAGDLYASGTISGETEDSFGSMLELCWKGTKPLTMEETGETRSWVEDGDTVIMTAYAQGDGYRIGFGEVRATVLPAPGE
jgi:fumarylacetoacetase